MVLMQPSVYLCLLASSLTASYLPTSPVLPPYTIPASSPTSQDSPPHHPESYDYVSYAIPRDDSYAGIDSYGVPVGEPLLRVPAPDQEPALDYYSYPTATGTGYGAPSAPVIEIVTEPPTEPPAVVDEADPVLSQAAILLIFGCLVLFLWPRTVVLEVLGTGSRREEEEEENRTEMLIDELNEGMMTTVDKTTAILPRYTLAIVLKAYNK